MLPGGPSDLLNNIVRIVNLNSYLILEFDENIFNLPGH